MKRYFYLITAAAIVLMASVSCQKEFEYFSNDATVLKVTPKQALITATVSLPEGAMSISEVGIAYADDKDFASNKFTEQPLEGGVSGSGKVEFVLKHLACGTKYNYYIYVKSNGEVHKGDIYSFKTVDKPKNAIDLGLPSDLLWADRNIGANSPEDHGESYAFGEVEPKELYTARTYKFFKNYNSVTAFEITKYTVKDGEIEWPWYNSKGEFIGDNKYILDREDDVVAQTMGDGWRMPLPDEFMELEQECEPSSTTIGDKEGLRFRAKNGNFIILPPTRARSGEIDHVNSGVVWYRTSQLWTANRSTGSADILNEQSMVFQKYGATKGGALVNISRYSGLSVRGVYDCSVKPSMPEKIVFKDPDTYDEPDFPRDENAEALVLKAGDPSVRWPFASLTIGQASEEKSFFAADVIDTDSVPVLWFRVFMEFPDIATMKEGDIIEPSYFEAYFPFSSYDSFSSSRYFGKISLESLGEKTAVIRFDKVMTKYRGSRYFIHGLATCPISD